MPWKESSGRCRGRRAPGDASRGRATGGRGCWYGRRRRRSGGGLGPG
jgi:hypothetical protein